MPFRDNYTNFNFNNQDSSNFKVWVTNNRDIQIALTPNFSDSFTSPMFGGVRYLNGTTVDKTDITVKCIAINVNMNEWRAICNWLAPNKIGKLNFDFNKNSHYNVKLSKGVNSSSFYNTGVGDKFNGDYRNIEFSLEFTTVGDYAAIGNMNWASLRGEEEEFNYFNNYYFRNYAFEPQLLSIGDYAGGLTIDLRNLHIEADWENEENSIYENSWTYNFGLNLIDITLVLQKEERWIISTNNDERTRQVEETYTFSFSQEGGKAFPGLFKIPEGYYFVSTTASEEKLPIIPFSHCFNLGEYDEYPIIKLDNVRKGFEIYFNEELFYRYEFHSDSPKNNIVVNTKTSFIEYRGKLLEAARNYDGSLVLKEGYNKGTPVLSTGNPELHLAKVIGKTTSTFKVLLDFPLINNYDVERLGVAVFTGRTNNTEYGSSTYEGSSQEGTEYPYSLDDYNFAINCRVKEINGRYLTLELGQRTGDFAFTTGDNIYISLCAANTLRIVDLSDPLGSLGSITGKYASASRGAI